MLRWRPPGAEVATGITRILTRVPTNAEEPHSVGGAAASANVARFLSSPCGPAHMAHRTMKQTLDAIHSYDSHSNRNFVRAYGLSAEYSILSN
jgi:hypothetical protein